MMSVAPTSVAQVLAGHVTLEVESFDRLYLNVYVPRLQRPEGLVGYLRDRHGARLPSTALVAPMSAAFNDRIRAFARREGVPLVDFKRGQRKDDVAKERVARFGGDEGVLFVGRAQEKSRVFRTEKRRDPVTGRPYPWVVPSTAMVNQWYLSSTASMPTSGRSS